MAPLVGWLQLLLLLQGVGVFCSLWLAGAAGATPSHLALQGHLSVQLTCLAKIAGGHSVLGVKAAAQVGTLAVANPMWAAGQSVCQLDHGAQAGAGRIQG